MTNRKGFTLLELIIVVAIIALLAAATFVAVDPAKRIGNAQNAQRWSDVTAVLNGVLQYVVDNNGTYPNNANWMNNELYQLGTGSSCGTPDCTATTTTQTTCLDLSASTALVETYLTTIPTDPTQSPHNGAEVDYYIRKSSNGRVTVGACERYNNEANEVGR